MRQRVAQFAAFVDGAGSLGSDVAREAAGKRELLEQALHALFVLSDVGVDLRVGAFEVGVGDNSGAAVARSTNVNCVEIVGFDNAVEVSVDEIQAGRGAPVTEQPRLGVLELER